MEQSLTDALTACVSYSRRGLPYKTVNPFREEAELFFFCNAPHLLKTARNCFSNSYAHSKSRNMQVRMCVTCVDYSASAETTTTTPGVRLCHKLTKDHVWLTSFKDESLSSRTGESPCTPTCVSLHWFLLYRSWMRVWQAPYSWSTKVSHNKLDFSSAWWISSSICSTSEVHRWPS